MNDATYSGLEAGSPLSRKSDRATKANRRDGVVTAGHIKDTKTPLTSRERLRRYDRMMVGVLRKGLVMAGALALAACATAPERVAAPPPANALYLCPKIFIANAPPAGPDGRLSFYTPFLLVRGLALRRAPVEACLSSAYGVRTGGAGIVHDGLDLYTGEPRAVVAAASGRVAFVRQQNGYGLTIEIDHGRGVATRYAHLSSLAPDAREGARVAAGETIARTGRSGNATAVHLHYEIRIDGFPADPLGADR